MACETYIDCNENKGLSAEDLFKALVQVDGSGCPVLNVNASFANQVTGSGTTTGTSTTAVTGIGAAGGSLRNYIVSIQVVNTGSTTTLVTIQDGSGGATLAYTIAPAGGGSNITFNVPLKTTANTGLFFICGSASTTVYVSAQGYNAL